MKTTVDYKDNITIYHIPGIKCGATIDINRRNKENKRKYGEDIIIEILTSAYMSINKATLLENTVNHLYGYPIGMPYNKVYITHKGKQITEKTREKKSEAAIKANAAIKADPVRNASRSMNMSEAGLGKRQSQATIDKRVVKLKGKKRTVEMKEAQSLLMIEAQAAIKADPVRNASRSMNMSLAQAAIKADPVRNASRRLKKRASSKKVNEEIAADPIRYNNRGKKIAAAHEIKVKQYSLTGIFIKEYKSFKEAAKAVGLQNGAGIGACIHGRNKTAGGYKWKL